MSYFEKKIFSNFWKKIFTFITILCIIILAFAFFVDIYLDFEPCILCIYQRIPYLISIFLGIFALITNKHHKIFFFLICFCIGSSIALSVYHTGIEKNWWNPSSECSNELIVTKKTDINDFLNQISESKISDCRKPAIKILTLSLAEINFIFNLLLFLFLITLYRYNEKTKF